MRKNTNKYVIKDDYIEIVTTKGEVILIDKSDESVARKYTWHIDSKGYANGCSNKTHVRLHRLILNPPEGLVVDHINHNKLDNRRANLRVVTNQMNQFNLVEGKNNKSGKVGVHFNKQSQKWCSQITLNGKIISSKLFDNKDDAIRNRIELENQYHVIKQVI